jgi:hypothetical protein
MHHLIRRWDWIVLLLNYVINPARRLTTNNRRSARSTGPRSRSDEDCISGRYVVRRLRVITDVLMMSGVMLPSGFQSSFL